MFDKVKMLIVGYARGHNFSSDDLIGRIGRRLFPELGIQLRALGDLKLTIDLCDLSQLSVFDEIFVQGVYDLEQVPFLPDVILDCGAYVGMFTLLAASRFPKSELIAFEPDPENYRWLRRQITQNDLRVESIEAAVSDSDGDVPFDAGKGCGSSVRTNLSDSRAMISVKSVDLSRYIPADSKLLLKMDIEGTEELLLPEIARVLPPQTFVFLETHGGSTSWERLSGILRELGFAISVTRAREMYTDGTAVRIRR